MDFNSPILLITVITLLIVSSSIVKVFIKSRKRTAESIYKLIDDLEKKYIY